MYKSEAHYNAYMKILTNAYNATQNSIDELSMKNSSDEYDKDLLKSRHDHLQYLSDEINSLINDRSKKTETDTKPSINF